MAFEFTEVGARDLAEKNGILDGGEILVPGIPGIEDGCPRHNPCCTLYRILVSLTQLLIHRIM